MIFKHFFATLVILFLLFPSIISAQTDSLLQVYNQLAENNDKVDVGNAAVKKISFTAPDQALKLAQKNLYLAKKIDYAYGEAEALSRIGWAYDFKHKIDSSVHYYQLGIRKHKTLGNLKEIANNTNNIGVCYYLHGLFPEAVKYHIEALGLYKALKDDKGTARSYGNIGLMHWKLKNYKASENYYLQSLAIRESLKDTLGMLTTLTNLAGCSKSLGKRLVSIGYSNRVIALSKAIGNEMAAIEEKINLAPNYQYLGQVDKSIQLSKEAIIILEQSKSRYDQINLAKAYLNLASALGTKKSYSESLRYADKALGIMQKDHNASLLRAAHEYRYEANLGLGNYKEAIKDLELHDAYKDSIFNINTAEALAELSTKFQIDSIRLAQELISQKEKEKRINAEKLQKVESKKNNYLVGSLIFLGLLLISLAMLYYRNRESNKRLAQKNAIIKKSLEEKEILLREVNHRVKNNLQVVSGLLRMQSRSIKDETTKKAIIEAQERVRAMEIIHQQLYQQEDFGDISIPTYIKKLCEEVFNSHKSTSGKIDLQLTIQDVKIGLNDLISMGLILNELITNALKHGLHEVKEGSLVINLSQEGSNDLKLIVKDDGKGFPENFDFKKSNSFGLKIVNAIAETMDGEVHYSTDNGTIIDIHFKRLLKS